MMAETEHQQPAEHLAVCRGRTMRRIESADLPALQALIEACVDYFLLVEGEAPQPDAARQLAADGPPGWDLAGKILLGLFREDGRLDALIEGMRGYPEVGVDWIGLMLVDPALRGGGLGADFLACFEEWAARGGASQIGLGVAEMNTGARRFWERQGYTETSRSAPTAFGQKEMVFIRMRKPIGNKNAGAPGTHAELSGTENRSARC